MHFQWMYVCDSLAVISLFHYDLNNINGDRLLMEMVPMSVANTISAPSSRIFCDQSSLVYLYLGFASHLDFLDKLLEETRWHSFSCLIFVVLSIFVLRAPI